MLAIALAIALGTAAAAQAQTTVCLVAKPFQASGAAAGVWMWGYAQVTWNGTTCDWASADTAVASSPGPRITLATSDTTLTIHLQNRLPVQSSIVIPGLRSDRDGVPTRVETRAASFAVEAPAATNCGTLVGCQPGAPQSYTWSNVRPGTFMYQSGSHVQVQIQMGLYGAVTKDFASGQAYDGKSYASQVVLFYSEIDPVLHYSVAAGGYGGVGGRITSTLLSGQIPTPPVQMTSTYNYKPRYFLINGDAYPGPSTAVTAGGAGTPTLIRFLNAGLRTHVPTLLNGDFELVAEDAHPYPYPRRQVQLALLAGKTMDVLWTPKYAGNYPIFDRAPHLTTNGGGPGGMIASLSVGGTVKAKNDSYGARYDKTLTVAAPGVLGNDSATLGAALETGPACMTGFTLNSDGSFSYTFDATVCTTPPASDSFTYSQTGSNLATVTINLGANVAPVATDGSATTAEDTPVPITLTAIDDNSDPLTFEIKTLPSNGTLTGTPPNVTYTPAPNYNGSDSFTFTASDDLLTDLTPATVNITVTPVNDAPVATPAEWPTNEDAPITGTLTGTDVDPGTTLTFRVTTPPANGTLTGTPPTLTYTPRPDYFGTDSFRFVANDGTVDSPVATIRIPVAAVADNPIALNDAYSTKYNASLTMNVLANDKDPDGTPLTIDNPAGEFPKCFSMTGLPVTPCTATTTGVDKVTINSTFNRLTLVPNSGSRPPNNPGFRRFTFTYKAKDAGGALSAAATVTATVLR
jgi:hypothetical protein